MTTLEQCRRLLANVGLVDSSDPPESPARFADAARFRIEIPSVESPAAMRAVLDEAAARSVPIHRISQGSGVMLLSDDEITEMVNLGASADTEVSLFLGPRAAWGIGAQAKAQSAAGGAARGSDDLLACIAEATRAAALGIRSVLVADIGVLATLAELRGAGDLPPDFRLKSSVMLPVANPACARILERLGANTLNVSTDLTVRHLAEIRAATQCPIDVYIESPDDQGGFIRLYDLPGIIRSACPVYLKFAVSNAARLYPSGGHLDNLNVAGARERVRRAQLGLQLLSELAPELATQASHSRPRDLGIPVTDGANSEIAP